MAQLISSKLLGPQHQELLVFIDCFGKVQHLYLGMLGGPTRADQIASTLADMTTAEAAVTAYAVANAIDLTQALADGAAAIAAALAGGKV